MKRKRDEQRALVYALTALGVILSAVGAVEAFYKHPTYGRGLQALLAVVSAGRYL